MTRTFISWGGGDEEIAEKIYDYLAGLLYCDPWLYSRRIKAGAPAHRQISAAIEDAELFVMLVSPGSLRRKGYFQVEMKGALRMAEYFPLDRPYLVVCLLDDLNDRELPAELRVPHYVRLSRVGGADLSALKEAVAEADDYRSVGATIAGVTFTTHKCRFRPISDEEFQCVKIFNGSPQPVEIGHVFYRDPDCEVHFHPKARKLPVVVEAGESWETYVPVRFLPRSTEIDDCFRAQFSDGTEFRSRRGNPPLEGWVAGGPIRKKEILNYPTPSRRDRLRPESYGS